MPELSVYKAGLTRLGTGWDWAAYDIVALEWWAQSGKVSKQILLSKLLVLINKQIFSGASSKLFLSGPSIVWHRNRKLCFAHKCVSQRQRSTLVLVVNNSSFFVKKLFIFIFLSH